MAPKVEDDTEWFPRWTAHWMAWGMELRKLKCQYKGIDVMNIDSVRKSPSAYPDEYTAFVAAQRIMGHSVPSNAFGEKGEDPADPDQ